MISLDANQSMDFSCMCQFGAIQKVHYSGKWRGDLTEKVAEESLSSKKLIFLTRNFPYAHFFLQLNFSFLYFTRLWYYYSQQQ